jgi:hypothetical protein
MDSSAAVQIAPGRQYVDALDVTLSLGPGRYLLTSRLRVVDTTAAASSFSESDRLTSAVDIEVRDFDLDEDEPVPFWGVTRLPYTVRPLVRVSG